MKKEILSGLLAGMACVTAVVGWGASGCSSFSQSAIGNTMRSTLTTEDHLAAALTYQEQAQHLELEAIKYEQEAVRITHHEDPKGFRREGLTIAAQRARKEAAETRELALQHRQKAETLLEKQGAK